jgi:hypothetical protein
LIDTPFTSIGGDIVYKLDTPQSIKELKDKPFTLKYVFVHCVCVCFDRVLVDREGCKYKIEVSFRVQHEIVSGLCFETAVYKVCFLLS